MGFQSRKKREGAFKSVSKFCLQRVQCRFSPGHDWAGMEASLDQNAGLMQQCAVMKETLRNPFELHCSTALELTRFKLRSDCCCDARCLFSDVDNRTGLNESGLALNDFNSVWQNLVCQRARQALMSLLRTN